MSIVWEKVEPGAYEDLAATLLQHLHPDAERIDGAGGDDGRDMQLHRDGLLHVFELKSFTGRVGKPQRRQIEASLAKAAKLSPDSWTLVVPIDPTPGEQAWFEGLRAKYSFPLTWRGRTWLDTHLADRPSIERYYLQDANAEVVRLLVELRAEEARVESAGEAVTRLRALRGRLNDIDPFYRYDLVIGAAALQTPPPGAALSVTADETRVDVYEKFRGAGARRPITGEFTLQLGKADTELRDRIAGAFEYGEHVTIPEHIVERFTVDAPAGLGGTFTGGELTLGAPESMLDEPMNLTSVIDDSNGRLIASLPFALTSRRSGQRGIVLKGADGSGCITVTIRIDARDQRFQFTYDWRLQPVMPAVLLPAVRWMTQLRPPHTISFHIDDPKAVLATTPVPPVESELGDRAQELVEALDHLQRASGDFFDIPDDLTPDESRAIIDAHRLLNGEQLTSTWGSAELTITVNNAIGFDSLLSGEGSAVAMEADQWVHIRGHKLPIGRIRTIYSSAKMHPDFVDAVKQASAGESLRLHLLPGTDNTATRIRLGDGVATVSEAV